MTSEKETRDDQDNRSERDDLEFGSNAVRLSTRDWICAMAIVVLVIVLAPPAWKWIKPLETSDDYRVPFELSEDYWTYEQLVDDALDGGKTLVIGDSVVWGEYVKPNGTLTHHLNQAFDNDPFVNGGVNGTRPLALQGLVANYASDVREINVMLHCNLLWMSSKERDLQTNKEISFNHPRLVPQFIPNIPCYKAPVDERLGILVDRNVPFRNLVNHTRIAYYESQDLHSWTLEHPYENPISPMLSALPQPKAQPHSDPVSWTQRGIPVQDFPWIDLETSLQWQAFRTTVSRLVERGNSVFVVVGPFNEHLLSQESQQRYGAIKQTVHQWLNEKSIAHCVCQLLPSHEFADASHPLRDGYARIASEIVAHDEFQRWFTAASETIEP